MTVATETRSHPRDVVLRLFVAGAAASAIDLLLLGHFEDVGVVAPGAVAPPPTAADQPLSGARQ